MREQLTEINYLVSLIHFSNIQVLFTVTTPGQTLHVSGTPSLIQYSDVYCFTLFLAIVFLQLSMFTNHLTNIILLDDLCVQSLGGRPCRKLRSHIWLMGELRNSIDFYEI